MQGIDSAQIMVLGIIPMSVNAILYSKFLGTEKSKIVLTSASVRLSSLFVMILILGDLYGLIGLSLAVLLATMANVIFSYSLYRKLER